MASIRGWWRHEGRRLYPTTTTLLITADAGGSNGWRLRLWKREPQRLADDTHLTIAVCHFPPGTSKWNKVEHRLFSFISSNWRGHPLQDYETVVKLIARTTTAKGLTVTCRLDRRKYATGQRVTAASAYAGQIREMYEEFLSVTDSTESDLIARFLDPSKRKHLMSQASGLGDAVYDLMCALRRDSRLDRLLVV